MEYQFVCPECKMLFYANPGKKCPRCRTLLLKASENPELVSKARRIGIGEDLTCQH